MTLHHTLDPDQRLDLSIQSVAHQFEFAVWGDEADGSIILEPAKPYALVKFDVFHFHRLPPGCSSSRLKHDFVVESQSQLRHSRQIALHLYGAQDF